MACGCSKGSVKTCTRWIYTSLSGTETVYTSEVRALAAKVRDGNTGSVRSDC